MHNRHEKHDDLTPVNRDSAREVAPNQARPLADREVPLPGTAAADASASLVHQWLDGEVSEADARKADAKSVDFWKRLDVDADRMRRMKTPAHVASHVMAAIPAREPGAAMKAPSADKDVRTDR
jgi:hypothetical protein